MSLSASTAEDRARSLSHQHCNKRRCRQKRESRPNRGRGWRCCPRSQGGTFGVQNCTASAHEVVSCRGGRGAAQLVPRPTAQFVGDTRPDLRKFRITAAGRKLAPSSPAGLFFQRRRSRSRHVRCSKLHSTDTTSGVLSGNKNERVQCVLRSPRSRRLPHCLVRNLSPALPGGAFLWGSPTGKLGARRRSIRSGARDPCAPCQVE